MSTTIDDGSPVCGTYRSAVEDVLESGNLRSSGRGPRGKAKAVLFSEAYAPRRILTSIRVTDIKQYVVVSTHSDSLARPLAWRTRNERNLLAFRFVRTV